jgi:hypothetical protein
MKKKSADALYTFLVRVETNLGRKMTGAEYEMVKAAAHCGQSVFAVVASLKQTETVA